MTELPAVEVVAGNGGMGMGTGTEGELNTTPDSLYQSPLGQVETTIPASLMKDTRAFSVYDMLRYSPGISMKQGNGPRDVGISIRGSNARNGFGIRNIVVFEDGFPVTQPDGLSRTDMTDPHAYGAIDVIRGPSSALYGNYATGGAINFQLRSGAEVNGIEVGNDAGSFGYLNDYLAYGSHGANYDASLFASNVIGNGPTNHNLFNTQTVNFLGSYMPTPDDKITLKAISNRLYGDVSSRLSLNQFYQNPFQNNCYIFPDAVSAAAASCGTVNLFKNGITTPRVTQTAYQAGLNRNDTRSILGLRWEHNLDMNTIWRTQVVLDDKNISQPTGATSTLQDEPAINVMSDLTSHGNFYGFDVASFGGVYFNTESNTSYTYNVAPGGNATLGVVTQITPSQQTNMGMHGREEIKFTEVLTGIVGLGAEYTNVNGVSNILCYDTPPFPPTNCKTATVVGVSRLITPTADNNYYNIAPEGALVYRPNSEWLVKGRVGTGYGTPQASNLFVTQNGTPGNNTDLKSQTNLGYDLAAVWTPLNTVSLSVDGFYEFFRNELVNQTAPVTAAVAAPQTFFFNAPRSEHRGVEVAGAWQFLDGWQARLAYTYDNQIYTEYTERLNGGTKSAQFNRAGHWIPGIPQNELTVRLGYDVPFGPLKGLGAYAEYYLTDSFFIDNANLLRVPGYQTVNLNLHYDTDVPDSFIHSLRAFVEVRNLFDETYIVGANTITNTLNPTTGVQNPGHSPTCAITAPAAAANALSCSTGTIYAGFPRTIYGGIRIRF